MVIKCGRDSRLAKHNLPLASTSAQRLGLVYKVEGKLEMSREVFDQSMAIDVSIGNEGWLIGSIPGLMDLLPLQGDYAAFFAGLEAIEPILVREKRVPLEVCQSACITMCPIDMDKNSRPLGQ